MLGFCVRALVVAFTVALAVPAFQTPASAVPASKHGGGGGLPAGTGVDVSYPQCGSALPTGQAFGIVGVNGGLANDYNPCLSGQWQYALSSTGSTKQAKAQTYLNTGDPGNGVADWPSPGNLGSYGSSGSTPYGDCSYVAGSSGPGAMSQACAYIYGYDMVAGGINDGTNGVIAGDVNAFSNATGGSLTLQPVWLDVETGNSWQSGSTGLAMNVADLNGMVAALRTTNTAAAVGIYSTSSQWNQITGTPTGAAAGRLWELPDWIPGSTTQSAAQSSCTQNPFTGAPSPSPSGRPARSTRTTPASANAEDEL